MGRGRGGRRGASGSRTARVRSAKVLPRLAVAERAELEPVAAELLMLTGRACELRLGPSPDAEDARQEGLCRALERFDQVRGDFARASQTEARHAVYRLRREHARLSREELPGPVDPAAAVFDAEDEAVGAVAVSEMLRRLTPGERSAVDLWWAGYSLSEAAWRLRISVDAFEIRLRRARQHLRSLGIGVGAGLLELLRRARGRSRRQVAEVSMALRTALEELESGLAGSAGVQLALPIVLAAAITAQPVIAGPQVRSFSPTLGLPQQMLAGSSIDGAAAAASGADERTLAALPSLPVRLERVPTLMGAGEEKVADTQLTTAATGDYQRSHAIVGLGTGSTCRCPVLFQTTDGGVTWQGGSLGPPPEFGESVVLPPAYPADPRIFIASPPKPGNKDYIASRFGAPFTPLPLPPGPLAVSAQFDTGDPRVFESTLTGVVSYDVESGVVAPVLTMATADGSPALPLLATPFGDAVDSVVITAPAPGVTTSGAVAAATSVVVCARSGSCASRGYAALPSNRPALLALSPQFAVDHTLAVVPYTEDEVSVSTDGGQSFRSTLPPAGLPVGSVAIDGATLWAVVGLDGRPHSVERIEVASGATWSDVTPAAVLRTEGQLLAVSAGEIVDIVLGIAMRCTRDGGLTWRPYC